MPIYILEQAEIRQLLQVALNKRKRKLIMKKPLIILVILLMPALVSANFGIKFENTRSQKMIYIFYWLDHPFESMHPANMAAGELGALQSRDLSNRYVNGKYYVIWRDSDESIHEMMMDIKEGITQITVTPDNWSFEKDGL
jgi:hypothetical protein